MSANHGALRAPPVLEPGLYDMPADLYHADPCPSPSLNHTIAKILHEQSPLHAYNAHPRLGGVQKKRDRAMDIGTAVHALAIGIGAPVALLEYENFRTKAAQEARDALIASGATPLLPDDYALVHKMAPLMRTEIETLFGRAVGDMYREIVVVAKEAHTWSRTMIDVMSPDLRLIVDAKTTISAEPGAFGRYAMASYATQAAFIFQTLDLVDPAGKGKRRFVFIAQERDTPEAITHHELDAMALELADSQMKRARLRWALCAHTNTWPAYDKGPHLISPKSYQLEDEYNRVWEENQKHDQD